jgi:hypothetical protein
MSANFYYTLAVMVISKLMPGLFSFDANWMNTLSVELLESGSGEELGFLVGWVFIACVVYCCQCTLKGN